MIGPLAMPEMAAAASSAEAPAPAAAAPAPPPPIEAYPIERCARIAARIARRPEEDAAILAAEELAGDRWEALHELRQGEIRAELGRGRNALLRAYDQSAANAPQPTRKVRRAA